MIVFLVSVRGEKGKKKKKEEEAYAAHTELRRGNGTMKWKNLKSYHVLASQQECPTVLRAIPTGFWPTQKAHFKKSSEGPSPRKANALLGQGRPVQPQESSWINPEPHCYQSHAICFPPLSSRIHLSVLWSMRETVSPKHLLTPSADC